MCSPNRYQFSRSPYFGYRTGTDFPGALYWATEQISIFQEHAFLSTEQIPIFQEHLFSYRSGKKNLFRLKLLRISCK